MCYLKFKVTELLSFHLFSVQLTAAVVVPTDNKIRDVFVAYAIEANYNMPGQIADYFPPPDMPINPGDVM